MRKYLILIVFYISGCATLNNENSYTADFIIGNQNVINLISEEVKSCSSNGRVTVELSYGKNKLALSHDIESLSISGASQECVNKANDRMKSKINETVKSNLTLSTYLQTEKKLKIAFNIYPPAEITIGNKNQKSCIKIDKSNFSEEQVLDILNKKTDQLISFCN